MVVYNLYIIISIFCIIIPLINNLSYKYLFYVNIFSLLLIVNGFINIDKYLFLSILIFLIFRFIFLDKNRSKNNFLFESMQTISCMLF